MKRCITLLVLAGMLATAPVFSQTGARPGFTPDSTPPQDNMPQGAADFTEGFDDITTLPGDGWALINNSEGPGTTDWFQGNDTVFPAQAGAPTAYIAANFNNTDMSLINNWLLMPDLGFIDQVSFWTRTPTGSSFPDRLEIRTGPTGSTNVGTAGTDTVGDFSNLVNSINPGLAAGGYPDTWTQFNETIGAEERVAFRYYVTDGGPLGTNSDYIGIDSVAVILGEPVAESVPAMTTIGLVLLLVVVGGIAVVVIRRA